MQIAWDTGRADVRRLPNVDELDQVLMDDMFSKTEKLGTARMHFAANQTRTVQLDAVLKSRQLAALLAFSK
ncbi:hypothetical protein AXG89_26630 (plasmid) [Burkholderia sp. PAMC 26561]|nr:hypothetical protein AXG89_26060 [Burkholderia sp. PAMC 26561]AME27499.2 hypothetical protein AXG89_26630 [Burkholderia sp. PAMC 26561]